MVLRIRLALEGERGDPGDMGDFFLANAKICQDKNVRIVTHKGYSSVEVPHVPQVPPYIGEYLYKAQYDSVPSIKALINTRYKGSDT